MLMKLQTNANTTKQLHEVLTKFWNKQWAKPTKHLTERFALAKEFYGVTNQQVLNSVGATPIMLKSSEVYKLDQPVANFKHKEYVYKAYGIGKHWKHELERVLYETKGIRANDITSVPVSMLTIKNLMNSKCLVVTEVKECYTNYVKQYQNETAKRIFSEGVQQIPLFGTDILYPLEAAVEKQIAFFTPEFYAKEAQELAQLVAKQSSEFVNQATQKIEVSQNPEEVQEILNHRTYLQHAEQILLETQQVLEQEKELTLTKK